MLRSDFELSAPVNPGEHSIPKGPPFDLILFDCDSTLSAIEGIDELARQAGIYDEIAQLTHAAMEGELSLQEVYRTRLARLQPTRAAIDWLAKRYIDAMVLEARETIVALQTLGKTVHVVSGGLYQAVQPLAQSLGIDSECVHAVSIYWDEAGIYRGYDEQSPLARAQGKAVVCAALRNAGQRLALIGDGSTDLEAALAGVYVIGYGGVVQRPLMVAQAQSFVVGSLSAVLPLVLTAEEYASLKL